MNKTSASPFLTYSLSIEGSLLKSEQIGKPGGGSLRKSFASLMTMAMPESRIRMSVGKSRITIHYIFWCRNAKIRIY